MALNVGGAIKELLLALIGVLIITKVLFAISPTFINGVSDLTTNWTAEGGLYSVGALILPYVPFLFMFGAVFVITRMALDKLGK